MAVFTAIGNTPLIELTRLRHDAVPVNLRQVSAMMRARRQRSRRALQRPIQHVANQRHSDKHPIFRLPEIGRIRQIVHFHGHFLAPN